MSSMTSSNNFLSSHLFCLAQKLPNLGYSNKLQRKKNKAAYFCTESLSSLTPKIWEFIQTHP